MNAMHLKTCVQIALNAYLVLGLSPGGHAAPTAKTHSMTLKDFDTKTPYIVTIRAAPGFTKSFNRLYDQKRQLEVEITLTNWPLEFRLDPPFKTIREERTSARQMVVYDSTGNPNFSERYHLGISVKSKLQPDLYVTCTASHDNPNVIRELVALCTGISLKPAK